MLSMGWNRLRAVRAAILALAGFACLSVAAFLFSIILGWAAVGVSCLLLEYLTSDNERP